MKFERTERFANDFRRRLSPQQQEQFRQVARQFSAACDEVKPDWGRLPRSLRVKDVEDAEGVWEMTWSWPDGRATFEWIEIDGEPAVRWRRIGSHSIFSDP